MELVVGDVEAVDVARGDEAALFGEPVAKVADERAVGGRGEAMDDRALGGAAQERALDHRLRRDPRDERADLRDDAGKAERGEAVDGVADRRPRHAEFAGDGVLGERGAGLQVDLEDGIEQDLEDRVATRARSSERGTSLA